MSTPPYYSITYPRRLPDIITNKERECVYEKEAASKQNNNLAQLVENFSLLLSDEVLHQFLYKVKSA